MKGAPLTAMTFHNTLEYKTGRECGFHTHKSSKDFSEVRKATHFVAYFVCYMARAKYAIKGTLRDIFIHLKTWQCVYFIFK